MRDKTRRYNIQPFEQNQLPGYFTVLRKNLSVVDIQVLQKFPEEEKVLSLKSLRNSEGYYSTNRSVSVNGVMTSDLFTRQLQSTPRKYTRKIVQYKNYRQKSFKCRKLDVWEYFSIFLETIMKNLWTINLILQQACLL